MGQGRFLFFNVTGALLWVALLVTAGFLLGGLSFVRENFSLLIYLIILVSLSPMLIEAGRRMLRRHEKSEKAAGGV